MGRNFTDNHLRYKKYSIKTEKIAPIWSYCKIWFILLKTKHKIPSVSLFGIYLLLVIIKIFKFCGSIRDPSKFYNFNLLTH